MKFRFNDDILPQAVADCLCQHFRNVFDALNDGNTYVDDSTGHQWSKTGNNIVLLNPDETVRGHKGRYDVLRNAYHISAAFHEATVYIPLSNADAITIQQTQEPLAMWIRYRVSYMGE